MDPDTAFIEIDSSGNLNLAPSIGGVAIGTSSIADASAQLDIVSTTKGVLLPRMTTTQKLAITPVEGLEVYDLTLHQKSYYNGTIWVNY